MAELDASLLADAARDARSLGHGRVGSPRAAGRGSTCCATSSRAVDPICATADRAVAPRTPKCPFFWPFVVGPQREATHGMTRARILLFSPLFVLAGCGGQTFDVAPGDGGVDSGIGSDSAP